MDGEICSTGRLVGSWPPQGSSGGFNPGVPSTAAASAGTGGPWEETGSLEPGTLTALGVPGRVGLGFGCFLAVLACFGAGFFLTVCFASAPGAAAGAGGTWLRVGSVGPCAAGSAPSSAGGSRLRAAPCPGPPLPPASSAGCSVPGGSGLAGSCAASGLPSATEGEKWEFGSAGHEIAAVPAAQNQPPRERRLIECPLLSQTCLLRGSNNEPVLVP